MRDGEKEFNFDAYLQQLDERKQAGQKKQLTNLKKQAEETQKRLAVSNALEEGQTILRVKKQLRPDLELIGKGGEHKLLGPRRDHPHLAAEPKVKND